VSGGVLAQNTLDSYGTWFAPYYERSTGIDLSQPYTISVRARVLADSGIVGNDFGFGFSAMHAGYGYFVGLSTNELEDSFGHDLANDGTHFHDYRMSVTPGVGFELFIDNVSKASVAARYDTDFLAYGDRLALGDHTRGRGAEAEITFYEATNVEPIPEPASLLLLGTGLAAAARASRKRKA
jgi:hypothetical protein